MRSQQVLVVYKPQAMDTAGLDLLTSVVVLCPTMEMFVHHTKMCLQPQACVKIFAGASILLYQVLCMVLCWTESRRATRCLTVIVRMANATHPCTMDILFAVSEPLFIDGG
jgi:hypothetical protein